MQSACQRHVCNNWGSGGGGCPQWVQGRALAGVQGAEPTETHEILPPLRVLKRLKILKILFLYDDIKVQ